MIDPIARSDNVRREERIRFYSDVLQTAHKHKDFLDRAGEYDSAFKAWETLKNNMKSAKAARSNVWRADYRDMERTRIRAGVTFAFRTFLRSADVHVVVGQRLYVEPSRIQRAAFSVSVGWMWQRKVWLPLYEGCQLNYGKHVILKAERMRVNQKWIELYSVIAYAHEQKKIIEGYVAKTKTDRKNVTFHTEAAKAVSNAIELMHSEMDDLILKGSET